jgi:ATP-dependent Clp protease adaptor protein ClpS
MTNIDTQHKVTIRTDLIPPPQFKVIFINDDVTTVDFVLSSLITFFSYSIEDSNVIISKIHNEGAATVAIMPYELAEQKALEVTATARSNGFPLNIKLEPNL